ncbi:MAG: hypothetical protein AB7G37_16450 [Solirubrobacteraceae bacterium]
MREVRRRSPIVLLLAAASLGVTACGSAGDMQTTTVVSTVTVTTAGGAPGGGTGTTDTSGGTATGGTDTTTTTADAPLDARGVQRALTTICADEVDARNADAPPEFLKVLLAGDRGKSETAAEYNVRALRRMAGRLRGLQAEDRELQPKLVAAVDARRDAWIKRLDAVKHDAADYFTGDRKDVIRFLRIGRDTTNTWNEIVIDLGVEGRDCGIAVP